MPALGVRAAFIEALAALVERALARAGGCGAGGRRLRRRAGSRCALRTRAGMSHLNFYHNLLIGLHIIAVIAWMAGLLYLPRLFAYHTRAAPGSEMDETFKTMEAKLCGSS